MKQVMFCLCLLVAVCSPFYMAHAQWYTPLQRVDTNYTYGINWFGNTGNGVYDSLGFNNFNSADALSTLSNVRGTFSYDDYNVIGPYSGSQRILYTPRVKPSTNDTLNHYYFLSVDTTRGEDTISLFVGGNEITYWRVPSSASDSNILLMSQNELGGEWKDFPDSLLLAVRLQVTSLAPDSAHLDSIVASIKVQFDTGGQFDSVRTGVQYTFNIPWGWFNAANSDTCFFSNVALGNCYPVPSNFLWESEAAGCYQLGVSCECGAELSVYSKRFATLRLSDIVITDKTADSLMSGLPLAASNPVLGGYDPEDSVRSYISDSLLPEKIQLRAKTIDSSFQAQGSTRLYFYFRDEENMADFASSARCNQILNFTGTDEIQGDPTYKIPRYISQVQPRTWICPWFGMGGRSAYADVGILNLIYNNMDGINYSSATFNTAKVDSLGGLYDRSGSVEDSIYHFGVSWGNIICDTPMTGYFPASVMEQYKGIALGYYSSDFQDSTQRISAYDYSVTGHAGFAIAGNPINNALEFPSFNSSGTQHWWADIFIYSQVDSTNLFLDGGPPTPEELSEQCNVDLAFGAQGLWFYTNTIRGNCIGFSDDTGGYSSDYKAFVTGDSLPTMWNRNCLWVKSYSAWMKSYLRELFPMKWSGAFVQAFSNPYSCQSSLGRIDSSVGTFNIVNPSQSYEGRYMLNHWYKDSTQHQILVTHTVPDDTMFIVYSQFSDSTEPTTQYLYTVNLFQDDRSLDGKFLPVDTTFTMRGTRVVYSQMSLDSATSQYWTLTTLNTGFPDTQIAYNGVYRQTLLPGQGSVTRITPFCSYAERNIISDSGNSFNNGVHEVKHADGGYRSVYVRNDTVYERKMSECGISGEKMVEPGKASNNTFEYAYSCASLFDSSRTIAADSFLFCECMNPTIAEGRGGNTDEDIIVWEEDGWYKRPTHDTIVYKTIRAMPYKYSTDMAEAPSPYMIADSMTLGKSRTFLATPVVTGTNYGYVFGWADSSKGIKVSAMYGGGDDFYYSDSICTINAPSNHQPALFPSLSWGTDVAMSPTGHIVFAPSVHLVWQQPDSQSVNEIWHITIDVFFMDETGCTWFGENPIEQVSDKNAWWCDNTMPSVSADGQDSTSGIMGTIIPSKNTAHIVWHAYVLNDTINANRICYKNREFHSGQSYYSPTFIFASGVEQFYEPSIYVPPVAKVLRLPTTIANYYNYINVSWFASHDSYPSHDSMKIATSWNAPAYPNNYPFFTSFGFQNYVKSYPILGLHPTLSYSLSNDPSPSTVSQSGLSQYQLQSDEYGTFISDTNYSNALLNSVVIHPQKNSYTSGGCNNWSGQVVIASTQLIGYEPYYDGVPPVQPISIAQETYGNGVIENTLVRTVNLILQPDVPLVISRAIGARDVGANTALLSTGHSVELLIELVDSVGDVPLVTLDSFLITTPSDTGWRTGTLTYMPDMAFVGFPVYVRARIVADTNAARWNVLSMNELMPDTLDDGGGFAKPLRTTSKVPAALDSIGLTLYPNPATPENPNTRIMYSVGVEDANNVTELKIYNMLGEDVTTLVSGVKAAGRYAITFFATDQLPSGEYIVTVTEQTHTESKLLIITK